MPVFHYKAIDRAGQATRGSLRAASEQAARETLANQGHFVDELELGQVDPARIEQPPPRETKRLKLSEKLRVELVTQLATALKAQLPLLTALSVVGQQNPHARIKEITAGLADRVRNGESFSYAMAHYPRIFDQLHLSMVAAGENTGQLDESLTQLAEITQRELDTRNNILTAALYPAFVLCLGLISTVVVITWILPRVLETLAADAAVLPWPTRALLALSVFFKLYGPLVIGVLIIAYLAFVRWKRTAWGRFVWDRFKLTLPFFGTLQRKWAVARFARGLGMLSKGGVGILDALSIVRNIVGNEALARQVDSITQQVRGGANLVNPIRQSGDFPPLLVQVVAVGEETGNLDELLLRAADAFDNETNITVKRFMAIFPAILILLLALVVGFIVAATLLPIVQIETGMPGL